MQSAPPPSGRLLSTPTEPPGPEPFERDGKGLAIPFIEVAGRRAVPPTEFVRVFANELDQAEARFSFVHFLDGREKEHRAVVADAKALAATVVRPKWDIVQP